MRPSVLFCKDGQEALDGVGDGLLERDPVDAQDLGGLGVVVAVGVVDAAAGVVAAGGAVGGQLVGELGEVLGHDGGDLLVREQSRGDEEAAAAGLGALHGLDVRLGDVAHVYEQVHARRRDLLLPPARDQRHQVAVARVDVGQGPQVGHDGPEDEGRVDGGHVEAGLLALLEVPGGLLGQRLGHAVRGARGPREPVLVRVRVPVGLAEGLARVGEPRVRQDGGERAGDDDALHRRRVLLGRLEDRRRAEDGGVQDLRLGVREAEVEGRRRVLHVVEVRRRLQHLVEGVRLRHVGHDGDGQLRARVGIADGLGLLLGPHRRHDLVASLQEEFEYVGWSNVNVPSC